jgi:Protein of unknown function (DUF3048) N-terminal domain/Protein of unknown function (DUF3048) C-terminal domain
MRRMPVALLVVVVLVIGIGVGLAGGRAILGSPAASAVAVVTGSPAVASPTATASPTDSPTPSPSDSPSPSPSPTPVPTPVLVADPLDGTMVAPGLAQRHVVAVMIDDLYAARPQSGLSSASVVWQAPAEGGIPRYMALFSENTAPSIGPVRSSRLYFIAWAAEWNAIYAHVGGSPQALALLHSAQGRGSVVYDADEFRWSAYLWRIRTRPSPHNVYTDTTHLVALTKRLGAKPLVNYTAHWQFAPDAPIDQRPVGGTISFAYPQNAISYAYDRTTNTYLRSVSVEGKQVDAGTKQRIAPRNVVVMLMSFAPLNDAKRRLEAQYTGSGVAWISTNGLTVKGRWKKASLTAPTLFFGPDGKPVTLTAGQTFVNVVQIGTAVRIKAGSPPPPPSPSDAPAPSGSPSPSDSPGASPSGSTGGDWRLVV